MLGNGTPFAIRMSNYLKRALSGGKYSTGCSESIKPLIVGFFSKVSSAKISWDSQTPIASNLEVLTQVVEQLAYNTSYNEIICDDDMKYVQKIFDEFHSLYNELIKYEHLKHYDVTDISCRIDCLYEIVAKNHALAHNIYKPLHDGKLFRSYQNLYEVIRTVNRKWPILSSSGFSKSVFIDFYDSFVYARKHGQEKSEEEKMRLFNGILDGKMKFAPIYEQTAVAYQIIDVKTSKFTTTTIPSKYAKSYSLKPNKTEAS